MGAAVSSRWGRGAAGSAPRWHRGGRGFEPHRLHQLKKPKNLPSKTANCYQVLLPALHFPLAFKDESFTLCEEKQIWRTTRSSHASTPATESVPSSMCSSRKIIVRFQSTEQPTTSARATALSVRRSASARISVWLTRP